MSRTMSDPVTEELFRNAISAIGDEMVLTIYRTAYSGVLKNIMDYSAAICDAEGRLVAVLNEWSLPFAGYHLFAR